MESSGPAARHARHVPGLAWTLLFAVAERNHGEYFSIANRSPSRHYRAAAIGALFLCVLTATTLFAAAGAWRF
jgi:hypothetical protein